MDLTELSAEAEIGAVLELNTKTGEPATQKDGSPVTITLLGTDSKKWRKAEDAVGDRRLKAASPRHGAAAKSMEEQRNDVAFLLASVTVSWSGLQNDGTDLECNLENAKKLYLAHPFIREQVDSFLAERRNFLKASSPT